MHSIGYKWPRGTSVPEQLHIAEHGIDAQAVVLAVAPTGEVRNGRSAVTLTLRVSRPDHSMFDVRQPKALPPSAIPRLQPGAAVGVRYLPHDESQVAVVLALVS
ncbi:MAG: hypothetical protein ABW215_10425 [Kibdelosporangium sp.]